jgi:hypothetical protein
MLQSPAIRLGRWPDSSPRLRIPGSLHAVEARQLQPLQSAVVIAARRPVAQLKAGGSARAAVGATLDLNNATAPMAMMFTNPYRLR